MEGGLAPTGHLLRHPDEALPLAAKPPPEEEGRRETKIIDGADASNISTNRSWVALSSPNCCFARCFLSWGGSFPGRNPLMGRCPDIWLPLPVTASS